MTKRMLIDANHPEETRVVAVSGNRLEDFDFETSTKKQLKGNIYLAKVTRVEPSLQAAFVDYGGNRHGFLAFSEIHPDYYRIPISDREALIRAEAEEAAADAAEEAEEEEERNGGPGEEPEREAAEDRPDDNEDEEDSDDGGVEAAAERRRDPSIGEDEVAADEHEDGDAGEADDVEAEQAEAHAESAEDGDEDAEEAADADDAGATRPSRGREDNRRGRRRGGRRRGGGRPRNGRQARSDDDVETVGGDEIDDVGSKRRDWYRKYRIQEVISRRQIMLVQVAKEERGNKGAALTTFISLAGRYCVLMPNTPRGGGISRKITNVTDRKRLKSMLDEFEIPEGMAVIVRTAGMERTKAEVRRDYEYLIKLWDDIRERTLQSTAPALIHEEANLIKRAIRDVYTKDLDEVLVEGEEGYKTAKDFMKMMMPSHAKKVKRYQDESIPLFHRYQVEQQLDNIHSPIVQLKSGGYIVMNSTEALVAIDVNSGRSTRERNIEETAYRTNLEAAEEIARQLRLRDLAGLVVIDFIDMDEGRNRANVERKLKEAMKSDRARIQIGRISPFGLLELSRQRLRPSLVEASTSMCPHCAGTGMIRSTESTALHILRAIEEEGIRKRSAEVTVYVPNTVALYILNQKRGMLADIEARHGFRVFIQADDELVAPDHRIERVGLSGDEREQQAEQEEDREDGGKSRRGRRRGGRRRKDRDDEGQEARPESQEQGKDGGEAEDDGAEKPRRRGRRGGRKRRRQDQEDGTEAVAKTEDTPEAAQSGDGEPEAPSDAAESAEPAEPEEEKKPKTCGRKKAAKPKTKAKEAEAETEAGADEATGEPPEAEARTEEKPKRKRAASTRKRTPAKKKSDEDADGEPSDAGETRDTGAKGKGGNGAGKPAEQPAEAEEQPAAASESEEEDDGSRRTGWWSLRR